MTKHQDNARIFMAFCDVTRLKVLELLQNGDKTATELQEKLEVGQSTLSHHMKVLVESGMVAARKKWKWTYYSINERNGHYAARLTKLLTAKVKIADVDNTNAATKEKRRTRMAKSFNIVIDTGTDIYPEYLEKHNIGIMPITFMLDDKEHSQGSWQEISGKEFYNALKNGSMSKTAQINPDAFVESYTGYAEKGEDVLYLILSSGLSATYQSAQIAIEEIKESYPDNNIYPVDSLGATTISALMLMKAVQKREEGLSAAETAAFIEEMKNRVLGFFTVDDLMFLHRGGRLSKLSAIGGSLIGIKPILGILPDGTIALKDKVRGREAALRYMVGQIERGINPDTEIDTVFIAHSDCEGDAQKLADMIKDAVNVTNVEIIILGPVVGAHVGPGAIIIGFEADMTREDFEREFYKK